MKLRRSRLRIASTLALSLGLGLAAAACDKKGEGTDRPGGEGGNGAIVESDGKAPVEGGKDYVYAAEGFTLHATMEIKFEISSSEGTGAASIVAKSLIEATPADTDKLKIHGKLLELGKYEGSGQMDPEFIKKQAEAQGQEVKDIVAELEKAESWLVIDLKGELDEAATKALAENQGTDESQDFGLFNVPDLPNVDLVEGEKVKLPTREDKRMMPFGEIPIEIDETWTLRSIDADRIAEFTVTSEGSGATEISGGQGTAMVSTLEESSYTVRFNLATRLPVSIAGYSASETSIDAQGQSFSFAINNDINGTYEVAG